jgi:ABC-type molybdenum transport system ATPase subunit/photorepair protein PhrA
MLTATDGATPFRLDLHVGDVGHTMIVGPTGAGKSVLLATLAAQWLRYVMSSPARKFISSTRGARAARPFLASAATSSIWAKPMRWDCSRLSTCIETDERAWAQDWLVGLIARQT